MLLFNLFFAVLITTTGRSLANIVISDEVKDGIERMRLLNHHLIPKFVKVEYERNCGKDVLLSALINVYSFGTYAAFAKCNQASNALVQAINFKSIKQIAKTLREITKVFFSYDDDTLSLWAGTIFADVYQVFTREFIDIFHNIFDGNIQNMDFRNSNLTASSLNQWGSVLTGRQGEFISPKMIANDGRMLLLVNNYFEANLDFANPCETEYRDFYLSSGEKTELPTLHIRGKHNYAKINKLDAEVVELDLNEYIIRVVIPECSGDIPVILDKLCNPDLYDEVTSALDSHELDMYMPVIDIHYFFDLISTLKTLGDDLALESILYEGIFLNADDAYVSQIRVNLRLKVNARRNNTRYSGSCSTEKAHTVKINKPFIFYITTKSGIPMLGGVFAGESH